MLNLLFSFEGVINRLQFIRGIVIFDVILMPLFYLTALKFIFPSKNMENIAVFFLVFFATLIYGNFCIIFKRINDAAPMNRWQKLFIKSPFIIYLIFIAWLIIGTAANLISANLWPLTLLLGALIASLCYLLFYIIVLLFLPSAIHLLKE